MYGNFLACKTIDGNTVVKVAQDVAAVMRGSSQHGAVPRPPFENTHTLSPE